DGSGAVQDFLAASARRLRLWIVGGTIPLRGAADGRVAAASLVYDGDGRRVARYDKIHLFDVDIPGRAEGYRASADVPPGTPAARAARPRLRGGGGGSGAADGRARELPGAAAPRPGGRKYTFVSEAPMIDSPLGDPLKLARDLILRPSGLDDGRLDRVFGEVLAHSVDFADLYFQLAHQESWSLEDGMVKDGSASI